MPIFGHIDAASRFYGPGRAHRDFLGSSPLYLHNQLVRPIIAPNRTAAEYPMNGFYENSLPGFGTASQTYERQQEFSYLASHTPIMQDSSPPELPERRINKYDPDVDRALIEHSLEILFDDKAMNNGMEDIVSTDDWFDILPDNEMTESELADILGEFLNDSTHMPEMDLMGDSSLDTALEDTFVEQSLDDILDTVDDATLEDIADILVEPVAYDMPEEEMPEMDPDMDPIEDPMEISLYMV
ncbi:hypothetical protein ACFL6S_25450 [Candidatus Poribacteria bacterium]